MPNNVDERVLSMKFDNEGFEKKMRTTMETLEEFDEIEFKNITKNLDDLEKKGKGFNLDAITDSLKNIEEELSNTAYKTKALIKNITDDIYAMSAVMCMTMTRSCAARARRLYSKCPCLERCIRTRKASWSMMDSSYLVR